LGPVGFIHGKIYEKPPHDLSPIVAANFYDFPYRERWHVCMQESADIIALIAKSENLK
jgi:hypothetical protein